jgi:hypothetical protein
MLWVLHCLDNQLTDGGKTVNPTHRSRSAPHKHFSASGTHFCKRLSKPLALVRLEGLGKLKKFNELIGTRTRDLPIVPPCMFIRGQIYVPILGEVEMLLLCGPWVLLVT